jgi:hypothetical protein
MRRAGARLATKSARFRKRKAVTHQYGDNTMTTGLPAGLKKTPFIWLVLCLLAAPMSGSGRADNFDDVVRIGLAVMAHVFAGATIDYKNSKVARPDGSHERFELLQPDSVYEDGQLLIVDALQFPEKQRAVENKIKAGIDVANASTVCRIIMLRLKNIGPESSPNVVASREAVPDIASPLTTCVALHLDRMAPGASVAPGTPWSTVSVGYYSLHTKRGKPVVIGWEAKLDGQAQKWTSRLPKTIGYSNEDRWEDIDARQNRPDEVVFAGRSSGASFRFRCHLSNCTVPPDVVLQILP